MPAQLPTGMPGLPPLGGRLLAIYRLTWWLLLAIALAAVVLSWVSPVAEAGILALRLVKSAVLLAVSAILFRRRSRDPVAAMLSLAFLLWMTSSSIDIASSATLPALLDRFRFLLFALALLLFPDGRWHPRWAPVIGFAILAAFLLGIAEASGLLKTSFYLPVAIACVMAGLVALLARYRALGTGTQKQQLQWVTLGLFAGISLILTARAGSALAGKAMPLAGAVVIEGLFQLGIIVLALGFLISLLRYRLYDAEAAISRSAAYAGLTLALIGTFAASESFIQTVGQRYFGPGIGDLSGGIAAAIAAILLTPIHGRISGWAEQYFQRDLIELKSRLPDLLAALSAGSSLARVSSAVLPRIEQAVHASRIALLVDRRLIAARGTSIAVARRWARQWMEPSDVEQFECATDELFPLRIALRSSLGSIRGWLLLGGRPDGSFYGKDDLEALAEIALPLQRTLLLVAEREAREVRRRRHDRKINLALRSIEARLEEIESRLGSVAWRTTAS